jgi:ABC-type transport system substrate-binding protein
MTSRTLVRLGIVSVVAMAALLRLVSASSVPPAEFVFVNGTEPRTLDPTLMTGEPEGRIGEALFEGLARRDARTLRPMPGVAERWTISPDGLVYRFFLRPDARWSDGTFVTAQDFAASWRRLAEPATASEYAYLVHLVRGGEALHAHGAAADALDGPIRDAFIAWRATRDVEAADASDWQRFMAEHGVASALTGTSDPTLRDALGQRVGTISALRLDDIAAAFAR